MLISLIPVMCQHMIIKIKLFCTIIGTVRTGEGLVPCMDTCVLSEIALGCCLIGTVWTWEWLFSSVCTQVVPQVSGDRSEVGTVGTTVYLGGARCQGSSHTASCHAHLWGMALLLLTSHFVIFLGKIHTWLCEIIYMIYRIILDVTSLWNDA